MKTVAALLLLVASTGCVTARYNDAVLTVAQLRAIVSADQSEGQVVSARGYVDPNCYVRGCSLLTDPFDRSKPRVSLAGGTPVEPALRENQGRLVVLEGIIGKPRTGKDAAGNLRVTADRADEFIPTGIRK